ncbi:putative dual-specificity kinase [Helianthus annuus]|nr:putative dual-specificity kinase [Helianthus annuus]
MECWLYPCHLLQIYQELQTGRYVYALILLICAKKFILQKMKRIPRCIAINMIDFGCTTYDRPDQNYIVSTRHYRAPTVILGLDGVTVVAFGVLVVSLWSYAWVKLCSKYTGILNILL